MEIGVESMRPVAYRVVRENRRQVSGAGKEVEQESMWL